MKNKNSEYYLGIDGGGTKTEFLLTDKNDNEIKRLFCGCSNPVNIGIENTLSVLSIGISRICENISKDKISVFAGIAGAKTGDYSKQITDFLFSFGFESCLCGSDVDLALEMALGESDGTAVIMGTGIVAFSKNGEAYYRTGGRGYMIDKGGSGFHYGSDAINCAFEFIDGRGGSETIYGLVKSRTDNNFDELISRIYKEGPSFTASFAPVVFEAYSLGDRAAEDIIDKNAKETAKLINGAVRFSQNAEKRVVICGGLCRQKDILYAFITKYLDDGICIEFLDEPMVNAAVSLAAKNTGR